MAFLKKNYKYIFVFIFFFILLSFICFENTSFDFLWEYGFSHAIRIGEIPYKDFNTIVNPLYIFIMSLFLRINDSFVMYIGVQAFLCTILSFLLFKYVGNKAWLVLLTLSFPYFVSFIGTYNFLSFLLIVLLFYLEDNSKNDFYIGVVLGLLFLSKQTIGGVIILFNLLFLHNKKLVLERIKGLLIPNIIFLIYLIFSNTFYNYLDLCYLGLLDFGHSNGGFKILTVISSILLVMIFYIYYKKHDIKCSYLIGAFFFPFPIFDYSHFTLFLSLIILFLICNKNIQLTKFVYLFKILFCIILFFNIFIKFDFYKKLVFLDLNHFKYYLVQNQDKKSFYKVISKYKKYSNSYMISTDAMLYDIALDKKISFFDMPLTGNYGIKGTKGMINRVKNMHDKVFFINICNHNEARDKTQLDYYLIEHVIKTSKKIDKVLCYNVYYKE